MTHSNGPTGSSRRISSHGWSCSQLEHGLYCIGCCWTLMAVLVVATAMNLWAAAAIAAVVFAEKVLPAGMWTARTAGGALLVLALIVIV